MTNDGMTREFPEMTKWPITMLPPFNQNPEPALAEGTKTLALHFCFKLSSMAAFLRNHRIHVARSLFSTLAAAPAAKEPSVSSFRKMKSSIRHATNPETIAEIFMNSSDSSHFSRDRSVFDLSVKKLTKFKRSDIIEQILERQKKSAVPKTEGFWIRIMMLYSKAGMVDHAIGIFNEMESLGCKRTEKSFCAVLSVHLENNQFNELYKSFERIPSEVGISQTTDSYNIALKALYAFRFRHEKSKDLESVTNSDVDDRLLDELESKLEKMEAQKEVKPDINTYNIRLGACLKKDDGLLFDKLLNELSNEGLIPNLVTNNHKISRLCKKGECSVAKQLLDEMVAKEINPNLTSFNTVIDGFCKVKDFESAKSVFESMSSNSVSPDVHTYTTFVNHFVEHGDIDSALEFCRKGMEKKYILPFVTMEGLVNSLVKNSKVDEAKEIIEKMKIRLKGSAVDSWAIIESRLSL